MIEPDWLRRVIALAEADTGGLDADTLAALLSEPNEVLPYLFVHTNGFAGWPRAREAIAKAAANTVCSPRAGTDTAPGPVPAKASPDRSALYASLRSTLIAGDVNRRGETTDRWIDTAASLRLIGSVRFDENRGADSASLFIRED